MEKRKITTANNVYEIISPIRSLRFIHKTVRAHSAEADYCCSVLRTPTPIENVL